MATLSSLPTDLLILICRQVWLTLHLDEALDASRNNHLIALSSTCSRIREIALPFLFKYAYNHPSKRAYYSDRRAHRKLGGHVTEWNDLWPLTVWSHIRNLNVYDQVDYQPKLDVGAVEPILPRLHNLNRLYLYLSTRLGNRTLLALSALPFLHSLEIHGARLDGPPLVEEFLQLHSLTALIVTVDEVGAEDLNIDEELKNVADLLTALAPRLSRLEIAGDLIDLNSIAALEWPRLYALRLLNHVPDIHIPLSTLVSRMPSLRILGCDFNAGTQYYCDPIVFGDDTPRPDTLLPDLRHLSISNVQPSDKIINQLPRSLEVLRVLALRDNCSGRMRLMNQCLHYRALTDAEAFRWIDVAAQLPHLIELSLSLDNAPSPTMLSAIASACPGLRTLELEQARYEGDESTSLYSMESLAEPLSILRDLRELRITLALGAHNRPQLLRSPAVYTGIENRLQEAAETFAERLPNLEIIAILYCNDYFHIPSAPKRHCVWRRMQISRGKAGDRPLVQSWMYM